MPDHPILENAPLKIFMDDTEVSMIQFVYDIILNQNLELFTLLRRIPKKEDKTPTTNDLLFIQRLMRKN